MLNDAGLYVTAYSGSVGSEHDDKWMHLILVNPETGRFFCHDLSQDKTEWTHVKHLALDPNGTTGAGYIRDAMPGAKLRHLPLLCPTVAEHYARSDVA
jgi:hypothetical protein